MQSSVSRQDWLCQVECVKAGLRGCRMGATRLAAEEMQGYLFEHVQHDLGENYSRQYLFFSASIFTAVVSQLDAAHSSSREGARRRDVAWEVLGKEGRGAVERWQVACWMVGTCRK